MEFNMDKMKLHIIAGAFYNEVMEGDISTEEIIKDRMNQIADKFLENKWLNNHIELIEVLMVVQKLTEGIDINAEEE